MMQIQDMVIDGLRRMSQAYAPVLAAQGGGAIVNVLSALPMLNLPGGLIHCVSMSAAGGATHALQTLNALAAGQEKARADTTCRAVKRGLSAEPGIYL
jgi:NAD(P)-dependent dehydrogenase (short-subunit alcohol dehydrogenase family)